MESGRWGPAGEEGLGERNRGSSRTTPRPCTCYLPSGRPACQLTPPRIAARPPLWVRRRLLGGPQPVQNRAAPHQRRPAAAVRQAAGGGLRRCRPGRGILPVPHLPGRWAGGEEGVARAGLAASACRCREALLPPMAARSPYTSACPPLPPALAPRAGPVAGGVQQLAGRQPRPVCAGGPAGKLTVDCCCCCAA